MSFPLVSDKERGYDVSQVDGLISRARRQYDNPALGLMTSDVLQAARFSLVPAGYEVAAVDSALARIADKFEEHDIAQRVRQGAQRQLHRELEELLSRIEPYLAGGLGAFSKQRGGYHPKLVRQLMSRIRITDGRLSDLDSFELRTAPLGYRRSGLDRTQIDEFLALVIAANHRQRAL